MQAITGTKSETRAIAEEFGEHKTPAAQALAQQRAHAVFTSTHAVAVPHHDVTVHVQAARRDLLERRYQRISLLLTSVQAMRPPTIPCQIWE